MVRFLVRRPIAVFMFFTALFILGLIAYFNIPVSLLPNIDIPEITIQTSAANSSAREVEENMVAPVRQQLLQLNNLRDIKSESLDGVGIIRIKFQYGTNINLAFIEVNEKVDAAVASFPKDVERPKVIKSSATDIPIFYLNLTLKNDKALQHSDNKSFLELSDLTKNVIKRRIEQLSQVAMVDATGLIDREVVIRPDMAKVGNRGFTLQDIETALSNNSSEFSNMIIRDGYYEYNIRFSSLLRTIDDIKNVYIKHDEKIVQLKDIADVEITAQKEKGYSLSNGKRAISMAIIKHADYNISDMRNAIENTVSYFRDQYPQVEFDIMQNQSDLLDYTMTNLKENLLLGFILIMIIATLFLGDIKLPAIISICMIVSLVISLLFFFLFHVSLNIVSLSGLILALGMMIDNSIIVTDNITQYRELNYSIEDACVKGTTEVITPMLSSSLTTIAVFLPLIFMSGIAGALFYDQAFSVGIGLLVSYFTGIMLLPVLYKIVYSLPSISFKNKKMKTFEMIHEKFILSIYDKGIGFVFKHKLLVFIFILWVLPICILLFNVIEKSKIPHIEQVETIVSIDWNENIHIDKNRERIIDLLQSFEQNITEHSSLIGQQQFFLNKERDFTSTEAELYLKANHYEDIRSLENRITEYMAKRYPSASFSFSPPKTLFERIFETSEADMVIELYTPSNQKTSCPDSILAIKNEIESLSGQPLDAVSFGNILSVKIDRERIALYNIRYNDIVSSLRNAFKENNFATLRSFTEYLPIVMQTHQQTLSKILNETLISTGEGEKVPLSAFITLTHERDIKSIRAGKNGTYIPLTAQQVKDEEPVELTAKTVVSRHDEWSVLFSGEIYDNQMMMKEMIIILLISILLMYFILAAQFESFLQPFLVLMEIPIDIMAALFCLWVFGHTLNLMSAIGIIVTCGIVINDSILKLDIINELRKQNMPLMEAIHEAGHRRLRAIIMTSLTTIFAMVPLLWSSDIGSELQKPLAIATIGGMVLGTIVSLFILPLFYAMIYKEKPKTRNDL